MYAKRDVDGYAATLVLSFLVGRVGEKGEDGDGDGVSFVSRCCVNGSAGRAW